MDYYRRNELPETVKRYKAYTDSFQKWLLKTALQRDVECAAQFAEQAKENRNRQDTYKISTEQQERLVDAITITKEPLKDTSGLLDLNDAIRSRKEVAYYHKVNQTVDTGHFFFISTLEGARAKFASLIRHVPVMLRSHELADEVSSHISVHIQHDDLGPSDGYTEEDYVDSTQSPAAQATVTRKVSNMSKKIKSNTILSKEETQLQQDFMILCFLYSLSRVRGIIADIWNLFHIKAINIMTAALVTDLILSYIQQNVSTLIEDISQGDFPDQRTLPNRIHDLYIRMSTKSSTHSSGKNSTFLTDQTLQHLFCIDAMAHMKAYLAIGRHAVSNNLAAAGSQIPFISFLHFFEVIRTKRTQLPLWDKFTEDVLLNREGSDNWLPFQFQVLLDVQKIVREDYRAIFRDITDHAMDIAHLMRVHIDYEDQMWAIDVKPDYMSKGDTKFSNVFLRPIEMLLAWIGELFDGHDAPESDVTMTMDVFVTVHSTLAGLSMYYFNSMYQSISIGKVRWFILALCHLYNAARQVGGLEIAWPDLDFIIKMHGTRRIYVGDPPTKPTEFFSRYVLARGISSRFLASDYRARGKAAPRIKRDMRDRYALMPHFPLEKKIKAYYGPLRDKGRWVRRHAIFSHLRELEKEMVKDDMQISDDSDQLGALQGTFAQLISRISAPTAKKRKKKPSRVHAPDISDMEDEHAPLFNRMQSELQAHELHSSFDYLSFYRRAFELMLHIQDDELFNHTEQGNSQGNIKNDPNPPISRLIFNILEGLKIRAAGKKSRVASNEIHHTDIALDQLKRIADIMGDLIQAEGSAELDRAKLRQARDWEALRYSYAAERDALAAQCCTCNHDHASGSEEQVAEEPQSCMTNENHGGNPENIRQNYDSEKLHQEGRASEVEGEMQDATTSQTHTVAEMSHDETYHLPGAWSSDLDSEESAEYFDAELPNSESASTSRGLMQSGQLSDPSTPDPSSMTTPRSGKHQAYVSTEADEFDCYYVEARDRFMSV